MQLLKQKKVETMQAHSLSAGPLCSCHLAQILSLCFFSRGESLNALTVDAEAVLGDTFSPKTTF